MLKISVIIPIYNCENKLNRCLDSVVNQSYNNLEILCINDGSTDNSLDVCKDYEDKDPRIKVINLTCNKGVSNARNIGMKNATGDYIAFVDGDDYIEKNMYFDMLNVIEKYDIDIVLSDLNRVNNQSYNSSNGIDANRNITKEEINKEIMHRFTAYGEQNLNLFSFYTKLYKTELITKNNIRFDDNISYEEDKLFTIECLANANNIFYINKSFYNYEPNSQGLYSKYNVNGWKWYINSFYKFNELIDKYHIEGINYKYLYDAFIYNISWFMYRTMRNNDKELINEVLNNDDVIDISTKSLDYCESFDKRIAKSISKRNIMLTKFLIDFVYSGKKDKLFKLINK